MELLENLPFSKFCSLNITDKAKFYCEVSNVDELKEILEFIKKDSLEQLIIGDVGWGQEWYHRLLSIALKNLF